MSYQVQTKHGSELNRCYQEDLLIHDWYRFILSYPPHLVKNYLSQFGIHQQHCVLDPFCGTGTTLVECKKHGIASIGIEANSVVHLMAKTKVNWDVNKDALIKHAGIIAKKAQEKIIKCGFQFKTLNEEQARLIITDSINPIPLHKALILLETIEDCYDIQFNHYEKIAFAKQLVYAFSNLKFSPEVGVSRNRKVDVDVINIWLAQVREIAEAVVLFNDRKNVSSQVYLADSRKIGMLLDPNSIDAVITSPPYPNEKDYSRTTRLEAVLLGFINNKTELRELKKSFLRSNTRNVYAGDDDEKWIACHGRVLELAESIENKRIELGKNSGFEKLYHKVVKLYFGGMARHLEELKPALRLGAKLAYVVGDQASYFKIPIRTAEILREIAHHAGYEVIRIDLFRTRFSTATKEQLREEVLILKWNG